MNGHENANPYTRHSPTAAAASAGGAVDAEPGQHTDGERDEQPPADERGVGQRAAEQHGRARDRQRAHPVEQTAVDVLGDTDCTARAA